MKTKELLYWLIMVIAVVAFVRGCYSLARIANVIDSPPIIVVGDVNGV